MHAVLISTYDLGRQPFGLASPAAWLRRAGAEVSCVDTSRSDLLDAEIARADVIAFYLPMHTATRLAEPLIVRCRRINPAARIAAYGLYAPINAPWLQQRGVSDVIGPEAEGELVQIVTGELSTANSQLPTANFQLPTREGDGEERRARIPRLAFIQPDRQLLPPLSEYA